MVDDVTITPGGQVFPPETELERLHKRLAELEQKTEPTAIKAYLKFKAFLTKYIEKYPVYAAWVSGVIGAGVMYIVRLWFSF